MTPLTLVLNIGARLSGARWGLAPGSAAVRWDSGFPIGNRGRGAEALRTVSSFLIVWPAPLVKRTARSVWPAQATKRKGKPTRAWPTRFRVAPSDSDSKVGWAASGWFAPARGMARGAELLLWSVLPLDRKVESSAATTLDREPETRISQPRNRNDRTRLTARGSASFLGEYLGFIDSVLHDSFATSIGWRRLDFPHFVQEVPGLLGFPEHPVRHHRLLSGPSDQGMS